MSLALTTTAIMIHGGGFVAGSSVPPDSIDAARAEGLKPVNVDYTLNNIRQAFRDVRDRADNVDHKVVAYGESAGATLALLLAQRGIVRKAVALYPATDLVDLTPLYPTVQEMIASAGTLEDRTALSPSNNLPTARAALIQVAMQDILIPPTQTLAFAHRDDHFEVEKYAGTHAYPMAPPERRRQLRNAMAFLAH